MQTNELDTDTLRRLAEVRAENGKVVSLYLNLDPSQFATGQARSTAITSVLDEADREAREHSPGVREDVKRLRDFFKGFDFDGAHGVAVFASGAADLFEAIKLPRPVDSCVQIDDVPFIEPLADALAAGNWCVALVNRQLARIFRGSRDTLDEIAVVADEVHRRHDQGGWSQARYQRSVDKEAADHLKNTVDELMRRHRYRPFDGLFIAAPEAVYAELEERLHPYLKERLVGRIQIDVENSTAEDVHSVAGEAIASHERKQEDELLTRLENERDSGGRGATGLEDVLKAINERRVEALLIDEGHSEPGVECPQCGWLGPPAVAACPADGAEVEERDDVVADAARAAITQSARVVVVHDDDRLESAGSIGALLRF